MPVLKRLAAMYNFGLDVWFGPDLVDEVGDPGSDSNVPSEKAIRSAVSGRLVDNRTATLTPGNAADMSQAGVYTVSLPASETAISVSNPQQGHGLLLVLTPQSGSTITLDSSITLLNGSLDDSQTNYLMIFCHDASTPAYIATLSQEA